MTTTIEPPVEDRDRAAGAVSARGRPVRKAPLGWVPWVALALPGALALATLVIALSA